MVGLKQLQTSGFGVVTGASRKIVSALAGIPEETKTYALVLDLRAPRLLPPGLRSIPLDAGPYLYAGSARGPGGTKARLARHMRRHKPRHWHLDWLTGAPPALVRIAGFAAFATAAECDLVDWLTAQGADPVAGFGSSDCRHCVGHLVDIGSGPELGDLAKILGGTLVWRRDIPRIR